MGRYPAWHSAQLYLPRNLAEGNYLFTNTRSPWQMLDRATGLDGARFALAFSTHCCSPTYTSRVSRLGNPAVLAGPLRFVGAARQGQPGSLRPPLMRTYDLPRRCWHEASRCPFEAYRFRVIVLSYLPRCCTVHERSAGCKRGRFYQIWSLGCRPHAHSMACAAETPSPKYFPGRGAASQVLWPMGSLRARARRS
ncbi:hypothetical protein BC834DRAFT_638210 [Gloeopeniophorella convolvens]|nr:hypothetical protein BC834DRAFT_638210 [Gloeopeniophorella convolvens]